MTKMASSILSFQLMFGLAAEPVMAESLLPPRSRTLLTQAGVALREQALASPAQFSDPRPSGKTRRWVLAGLGSLAAFWGGTAVVLAAQQSSSIPTTAGRDLSLAARITWLLREQRLSRMTKKLMDPVVAKTIGNPLHDPAAPKALLDLFGSTLDRPLRDDLLLAMPPDVRVRAKAMPFMRMTPPALFKAAEAAHAKEFPSYLEKAKGSPILADALRAIMTPKIDETARDLGAVRLVALIGAYPGTRAAARALEMLPLSGPDHTADGLLAIGAVGVSDLATMRSLTDAILNEDSGWRLVGTKAAYFILPTDPAMRKDYIEALLAEYVRVWETRNPDDPFGGHYNEMSQLLGALGRSFEVDFVSIFKHSPDPKIQHAAQYYGVAVPLAQFPAPVDLPTPAHDLSRKGPVDFFPLARLASSCLVVAISLVP